MSQVIVDLGRTETFDQQLETLTGCDLFFVDAPKDGVFEQGLFAQVATHRARFAGKLFVLDDIRLGTMVRIWADLPFPKLDISGLGHWSGTGLVLID